MRGSCRHMWLKYYASTKIKTGYVNKDLTIDILRVVRLLGVTMLVLGSCGWLLLSCVVELLWLDTNKKGCVDVNLPLVILVFLEAPQIPT